MGNEEIKNDVSIQSPGRARSEVFVFARKASLFCLGALVIFSALNSLFLARTDEAAKRKFQELYYPTLQPQVVIFGDSHTANGLSPRYLETKSRSVYNFSFEGADSIYYHYWYPLFQKHYPSPKTALVQLDWFAFRDAPYLFRGIEVDSEYLSLSMVLKLWGKPDVDSKKLFLSRFPLFQNRQKLDLALLGHTFGEPLITEYYRGFVPVNEPVTQAGKLAFAPYPARESKFREFINQLKADGIKVILIQTPEYIGGREFDPFYQMEVAKAAQDLGVPFLNFNTDLAGEINEDLSNFTDWAHLNQKGAELFSRRLAEELTEKGLW